jgi:hypothetical protein
MASTWGFSAEMTKHNKSSETRNGSIDKVSPKRGRGRPPRVSASSIKGHADNYRGILHNVWDRLWPRLSEAQTTDEVAAAFENATPGGSEFTPHAALILSVLKDSKFPKRQEARINFLADSTAGLGLVTPRRSRDICAQERAREKRTHHILRYEYYVECSCGYKGHSEDHACPKCGARIRPSVLDGYL